MAPSESDLDPEPGTEARRAARRSATAVLATVLPADPGTHAAPAGGPHASLVAVATDVDGAPLMLLSDLALHTRALRADPRASLLFAPEVLSAAGAPPAEPLATTRATVAGHLVRDDEPRRRARFLARHPAARRYADLGDFAIWRMEVATVHLVGGFGRIARAAAGDYLLPSAACDAFAAEADALVAALSRQQADAPALACDPDGYDLLAGRAVRRRSFPSPVYGRTEFLSAAREVAPGTAPGDGA
jgi:hypothetical protein